MNIFVIDYMRYHNMNYNKKSALADILELPKEIILNQAYITIIGNKQITIENYKNLIEYTTKLIRLNTANGKIKITGDKLYMKELTCEDVLIYGNIGTIEFI